MVGNIVTTQKLQIKSYTAYFTDCAVPSGPSPPVSWAVCSGTPSCAAGSASAPSPCWWRAQPGGVLPAEADAGHRFPPADFDSDLRDGAQRLQQPPAPGCPDQVSRWCWTASMRLRPSPTSSGGLFANRYFMDFFSDGQAVVAAASTRSLPAGSSRPLRRRSAASSTTLSRRRGRRCSTSGASRAWRSERRAPFSSTSSTRWMPSRSSATRPRAPIPPSWWTSSSAGAPPWSGPS